MPITTFPSGRPSLTKIVATVGPASSGVERLMELIHAGVDVFRVNTAHGDREEHEQRLADIRAASRQAGVPVAILVDLAGPKMRLGELPGGQVDLNIDDRVRFVRGAASTFPGQLTSTYERLIDELDAGDRVLLADGIVSLVVEQADSGSATCRVVQGGTIRSRQGINLPGVKLSVPALSDRDRDNALWAAGEGIDFISLSFVRRAEDVTELRSLVAPHRSSAQLIAKIEKPEALDNLEAIVAAADGVMVARGDLGVEIDIAGIAMVQKRIISACHRARKPVIVATQMLDSMHRSRLPTRAEATDVANAILDGADACMLSGETAIGEYPRLAVEMMHRIATATEAAAHAHCDMPSVDFKAAGINPITECTSHAALHIAEDLKAKMIVVATASGQTALSLSKYRSFVPTVGVSESEATLRRMCLYWGVVPLSGAPTDDASRLGQHIIDRGRAAGYLGSGDRVVLISGTGLKSSRHNMIVVQQLD